MALFSKKTEAKPELPAPSAVPRAYGIDEVIQLMRTLPLDEDPELILFVVRNTLASMNVDLSRVIEDARAKEERLAQRITEVRASIVALENEALARTRELGSAEADLRETTTVKERLEHAAQQSQPIITPDVGAGSPADRRAR